jgi:hypothetical protein
MDPAEMALTAEQHSEIATAYEKAATDCFVPAEQRAAFAKKAEFFRLLAKLAAKRNASVQRGNSGDSNKGADLPQRSVGGVPPDRRQVQAGAKAEPEPPAHLQALTHLALRWRLFRLETQTFGRREISSQQPVPSARLRH